MLNDLVRHPGRQRTPRGTAVVAGLRSLTEYLRERGHAVGTIAGYGRVANHFIRWLARRDTSLSAVNERKVKRFLDRHLPRCRCPQPGPRTLITARAALHHLLRILRREGRVPARVPDTPPAITAEIAVYDAHLRDTCGLASATRVYRRRYLREFLHAMFGSRAIQPRRLRPTDIMRFITGRAQRCQPGSAQVLASSLRSWLLYQQLIGAIDARLVASVPGIPRWRLATLPSGLDEADVGRLLNAINRTTSSGRRDYAIARCAADLGLRACEVASLELDDLDWRRSALRVPAGKARRADWLPLPPRLGRAIADYLRWGRPRTVERALFVRHHPPVGMPIGPNIVRLALHRAAIKAGIEDRWRGPHALRHTMATRLLRGGASLKEVADILRHRSLDTTAIYTKVDLCALEQAALPWPGRTP